MDETYVLVAIQTPRLVWLLPVLLPEVVEAVQGRNGGNPAHDRSIETS